MRVKAKARVREINLEPGGELQGSGAWGHDDWSWSSPLFFGNSLLAFRLSSLWRETVSTCRLCHPGPGLWSHIPRNYLTLLPLERASLVQVIFQPKRDVRNVNLALLSCFVFPSRTRNQHTSWCCLIWNNCNQGRKRESGRLYAWCVRIPESKHDGWPHLLLFGTVQ